MNQIRGLLASHGIRLTTLRGLPDQRPLWQWDGQPLPRGVSERLLTTWARLQLAVRQRAALVRARRAALAASTSDPAVVMVQRLLQLRSVGEVSAWLLTMELFSWRRFRNRREVAGILGLTATPHASADRRREQGIVQEQANSRSL